MGFQVFIKFILALAIVFPQTLEAKSVCIDTKNELETSGWKFNTEYKYVDAATSLPRSFGNLNTLEGTGIWYVEGSGTGKEIKFASDMKLYNSRSRTVQIFIKYYSKTPRRISLYPVKASRSSSSGPILLLPESTGAQWSEVRQDIDPSDSPIEISGVLSAGQFILFEQIVVTVDTSLPWNASVACVDLTAYAAASNPAAQPPSQLTGPRSASTTTKSPSVARPAVQTSSCPATPPPTECKCNCNCNCVKCE